METVERVVVVPKAATDLGVALEDIVKACKKALDDGWQAGQDLPAIAGASVMALIPVISSVTQLGDEAKLAPVGLAKTLAISAGNIAETLLQPAPAPAVTEAAPAPTV